MKRALLAATAIVSSSFVIPAAPAFAASDPEPDTAAQQQVCDDLYVATQSDPSVWRATVEGQYTEDGDSLQVPDTERNINYRPDTGSTFSYAGFTNTTSPLVRIGGSPNMWGQMVFSQKVWDDTLYDVEADFAHTVTFHWTCHVEEYVTTHVGGGNDGGCPDTAGGNGTPPSNGNGQGNNGCGLGNGGSNENSTTNDVNTNGNGEGNNGCGLGNGGGTREDCGGGGGHDVSQWEDRGSFDQSADGGSVDDGYQTIATDQQVAGHVDGVDYVVPGVYTPSGYYLLSCISPGKKGGSWTAKSYYTGGQCSTTTFNSATTVLGNVFDAPPTASLPAN